MAVQNADRLARSGAIALWLLSACALETQALQENAVSLDPTGGSGGSGASAGVTAGSDPVGMAGTFVTAGSGGSGVTGGMSAVSGGGSGGSATAGGGGAGGGGAGGKGGSGGKGGAGGMGGAPANPCATGKLDIDAATASSEENGTLTPNLAFDGNGTSRWASAQMEDPQWIYFDLGEVAHVSRVQIIWEVAFATNYQLEIAQNSNGPWTEIFQEDAGDGGTDNVTTLTASNGRYVRMHGNTRATMYGYSIWEFEIYGDLDETCK